MPQKSKSQVGKDFQALSSALSTGDVATAQQAFATLQQDMQKTEGARGHHHKKDASAPMAPPPQTPPEVTIDSTASATTDTGIDQLV